jgi:selenocysteine lyase/cysteine desulfurase
MLVGRDAMVDTAAGEVGYVHLDNGASTPTFEPIWDAFRNTLDATAAVQVDVIRQSSKLCGAYFGAPEQDFEVLFTANTTEAVNIAVQNLEVVARERPGTVVLNTLIEHNSNELPWRFCSGVEQVRASVDSNGFVDLVAMEEVLAAHNERGEHGDRRIRLVCVCGASNVMGTYSDIPAIGRLVRRYGAQLLVDAAQLSAHRAIDMARDNVDFLTFSAHKMYAPFGSGGLVARRELLRIDADDLAFIRQSGAENAAGIAALGKAVNLLSRIGFDALIDHEAQLTRRLLDGIATIPGVKVYGISDPDHAAFSRKGGLVCFEVGHLPHNVVARRLAEQDGIGVRSGCFCVNLYVKKQLGIGWFKDMIAHIGLLVAPSMMQPLLLGLVRVSMGLMNNEADVDRLIDALRQIDASPSSVLDQMLARSHFGTFDSTPTDVSRRVDDSVREIVQRIYLEGLDKPSDTEDA